MAESEKERLYPTTFCWAAFKRTEMKEKLRCVNNYSRVRDILPVWCALQKTLKRQLMISLSNKLTAT